MLNCVFNGSSGYFSCATFLTGKLHGCTPNPMIAFLFEVCRGRSYGFR